MTYLQGECSYSQTTRGLGSSERNVGRVLVLTTPPTRMVEEEYMQYPALCRLLPGWHTLVMHFSSILADDSE